MPTLFWDASGLAKYYTEEIGETCVLVAADARFCRSAQAEGLAVLDPELLPAADVPAFLSTL